MLSRVGAGARGSGHVGRGQLGHRQHRLDVQLDLLKVDPQFWILEAARKPGKAVGDNYGGAVDCFAMH